MMSHISGLSEVSEALGIAWKVYEYGWVQERSPNPQLTNFGEEIQRLAQSLSRIIQIVENARICYQQHALRQPLFRGSFVQKEWNLASLHDICGMFRGTISECEQLLAQNREVYRSDSSAYGDEWILVMKPKVDELSQRLQMHSTKLELVLKPLESKLLGDVRHEFGNATNPQDLRQGLPNPLIQGLVVLNLDQIMAEYRQPQHIRFDIPAEIEKQTRAHLEQLQPALRLPGALKLQAGLNMFVEYYNRSTKSFTAGSFVTDRTPSAKQFINLINCSILLQNLQHSQELRQVDQNSIWPFLVAELGSTLRSECHRFSSRSSERLVTPDFASLQRELRGPSAARNSKEDVSKIMSPHFETYSKPILTVQLPSLQEGLERQLSISQVDTTKLRLVETVHEKETSAVPLGEIVMNIDMKTVQLTPIYATPSSRPRPLEVLLHTGTGQLKPSFVEAKHIYRFQHLLTGYKVYDRYDQAMVKVSFFIAGQSTPLEEHGRVQLWLPQPFSPGEKLITAGGEAPRQSSGSVLQEAPAFVPTQDSASSIKRAGSIRKWIPGLRKDPRADEPSSRPINSSSSYNTTTTHLYSSSTSPSAPYLAPTSPPSFGPFELAAEASSSFPSANSKYNNSSMPQNSSEAFTRHLHAENAAYSAGLQRSNSGYAYSLAPTDDLPEISQPLSNMNRHDASENNCFVRDSACPDQVGWPYSPDSFAPPTPWHANHHIDPSAQHQRRPSDSGAPSFLSNNTHTQPTLLSPVAVSKGSPSVVSTRSTRSHSSMASSVTTIRTSTGASSVSNSGVARMHHKPHKPLLVIFLKSRDAAAKLSIVAIQIDSHTSVVRERCECYNSHSSCRTSCIERNKTGSLLAQRWEADSGLSSFNVAKLGEFQRKEGENLWPNLRRVSLKFEKMEDRYRFAGSPCSCNVKTTHELSRCNLQSHNGVFGIVKQIGDQVLLNYHNERNSAATKAMHLGPLKEDEV